MPDDDATQHIPRYTDKPPVAPGHGEPGHVQPDAPLGVGVNRARPAGPMPGWNPPRFAPGEPIVPASSRMRIGPDPFREHVPAPTSDPRQAAHDLAMHGNAYLAPAMELGAAQTPVQRRRDIAITVTCWLASALMCLALVLAGLAALGAASVLSDMGGGEAEPPIVYCDENGQPFGCTWPLR